MSEVDADLLYGVPSIAQHLRLKPRQVYHLIEVSGLPTFRLGGKVCTRRSTLTAWLTECEAKARMIQPAPHAG
ncbi:DNA-binding protein [Bosea sp. 2RAB26]|uniref:DNA-binding protein n=1 Tax=Bosea sp. 2RAB26 TaxID=3237476 RepID=UPI003F9000DA